MVAVTAGHTLDNGGDTYQRAVSPFLLAEELCVREKCPGQVNSDDWLLLWVTLLDMQTSS